MIDDIGIAGVRLKTVQLLEFALSAETQAQPSAETQAQPSSLRLKKEDQRIPRIPKSSLTLEEQGRQAPEADIRCC